MRFFAFFIFDKHRSRNHYDSSSFSLFKQSFSCFWVRFFLGYSVFVCFFSGYIYSIVCSLLSLFKQSFFLVSGFGFFWLFCFCMFFFWLYLLFSLYQCYIFRFLLSFIVNCSFYGVQMFLGVIKISNKKSLKKEYKFKTRSQ